VPVVTPIILVRNDLNNSAKGLFSVSFSESRPQPTPNVRSTSPKFLVPTRYSLE